MNEEKKLIVYITQLYIKCSEIDTKYTKNIKLYKHIIDIRYRKYLQS